MKILALILARGGSKRIPKKNVRLLGAKPLISWSIDAVKSLPEICEIMVSTDDTEIKKIAEKFGAYVPWLRPYELATDISSSSDAALHALNWYENEHGLVDGVLLLQPTSPFRTKKMIKEGIALFLKSNLTSVIGVSPSHAHTKWTFRIKDGALSPFLNEHGLNLSSQELEQVYIVNGSFYLVTAKDLRKNKSFFIKDSIPLVINSKIESLDIDTEQDWEFAEYCLNKLD